jgi:hypothetical protein
LGNGLSPYRRYILAPFIVFCPLLIKAQDDFGMWFSVSPDVALNKKTELKFSGAVRTFNNGSQIKQLFLEAGAGYKVTKSISLAAYYRLVDHIEDDGNYYPRHRLSVDLLGSLKLGRFEIFDRLRFQRVSKTYIETDDDLIPVYALRGKIGAEYSLSSFPLKPYIFYEGYTPVSPDFSLGIDKFRLSAGAILKITHKLSIDAGYIFQRDFENEISNIHVISLDLKIKL